MNNKEILENVCLLAANNQLKTDISDVLYQHGCLYLLSNIPHNAYANKIKAELILNAVCVRERYITLRNVFTVLQKCNIRYAVIKGAVLSQMVYGDISYRKSGDIDLLINRKDIDKVKEIIINSGFIQGRVTENGIKPFSRNELIFQSSMSHQVAPFVIKTHNPLSPYVNIDVNTDIFWGESKRKADMNFILSHIQETIIYGDTVYKLTPETEFAVLCLHHYKDMNSIYLLSKGSLKLSLFCDIYYYIKNGSLDIAKLHSICSQLGIIEFVYYCLYYTDLVFKDCVLYPYLSALRTEKTEGILNTFGLAGDEIKEWGIDFTERLFGSIRSYFSSHLSQNEFDKINLNNTMM